MQKGPYFQNVAYISPFPEGYMQAATQSGRSIAAGIESLGNSISKGIEQYRRNEEERSILGSTITQYLKNDSEIAASLDPKLLQKFSDGKASLKDHKDMYAAIGTNVLLKDRKARQDFQAQQLKLLGENLTAAQNQNAEFTRLKQERDAFNAAIKNNTVADTGTIDWQGVGQSLIDGGFNPASDAVAKASENERKIRFPGPSATTVKDENGNPVATVVESEPGQSAVIAAKTPVVRQAESPIGKLWSDFYSAKSEDEQQSIMKQIEGETKKATKEGTGAALTEAQSNALNYTLRMRMNNQVISQVEYNPANFLNGSLTPLERWKTDDRKRYETAKRNWVSANLRKESGAAIGPKEYEEADAQYFPQPGDGEGVIKQKAALRAQAELGMMAGIGPDAQALTDKYTYKPATEAQDAGAADEWVRGEGGALVKKPKKK